MKVGIFGVNIGSIAVADTWKLDTKDSSSF